MTDRPVLPGSRSEPGGAKAFLSDALGGSSWAGGILAVIGAVLLAVSFSVLDWMKTGDFGVSRHGAVAFHYRGIDKLLNVIPSFRPRFAVAYFGWLGLTLAILTVIFAVAANGRWPMRWLLRAVAVGLAFIGFLVTLLSVPDVNQWGNLLAHGDPGDAWSHMGAQIGWYLALVGFVLAGVGGATGSWRGPVTSAGAHDYAGAGSDDVTNEHESDGNADDTDQAAEYPEGDYGDGSTSAEREDRVYVPVAVGGERPASPSDDDSPTPPEGTPKTR